MRAHAKIGSNSGPSGPVSKIGRFCHDTTSVLSRTKFPKMFLSPISAAPSHAYALSYNHAVPAPVIIRSSEITTLQDLG